MSAPTTQTELSVAELLVLGSSRGRIEEDGWAVRVGGSGPACVPAPAFAQALLRDERELEVPLECVERALCHMARYEMDAPVGTLTADGGFRASVSLVSVSYDPRFPQKGIKLWLAHRLDTSSRWRRRSGCEPGGGVRCWFDDDLRNPTVTLPATDLLFPTFCDPCPPPPPPVAPGPLRVEGPILFGGNGEVALAGVEGTSLRGFSLSCTEYAITGPYCWGCEENNNCQVSGGFDQMIENLLQWSPAVVRIPIYASTTDTSDGWYDPVYRRSVDRLIGALRARGKVVVLDLHWAMVKYQTEMPPKGTTQIWTDLATAYKGDEGLLLELFNEPYPGGGSPSDSDWDLWLNGNDQYDGMQSLVDAVRAAGNTSPVVVGGLMWAYDLSRVITGEYVVQDSQSNLMYASHPYNNSPEKVADTVEATRALWDQYFGNLAATVPVFLTEAGQFCMNSEDAQSGQCTGQIRTSFNFVDELLRYAQEKGISWTAWAWDIDPGAMRCSYPQVAGDTQGQTLIEPGVSEQVGDLCGCPSDVSEQVGCGANWKELWAAYGNPSE